MKRFCAPAPPHNLFLSIDPLYPSGLDENRAVDDLYAASWICSETTLLYRKNVVHCTWSAYCTVQNFSDAVTWLHYISRMQRTNHLLHDSHPDQEGTKGPLTGKNCWMFFTFFPSFCKVFFWKDYVILLTLLWTCSLKSLTKMHWKWYKSDSKC